eukprot:Gregarina_sp_Poly_1__9903@NODE_647_length_6971_cov_180_164253_g493_i0_p3_GENE_NODE_647_length_6971_cov_180_164253_g493_i0NODE_647_length_6971_cov_180_164253_g493_i0_p3_ORF_typecomplete_len263_score30_56_NODE_647_length_6971_cov_180_164253_g493_i029923780
MGETAPGKPTFMSSFDAGNVPEQYKASIIRDPFLLQGKWKEVGKPFQQCDDILARLGFIAIKRKIAARCHSDMDLLIIASPGTADNVASPPGITSRTSDSEESTERPSLSTAATTPNPSVPSSQPVSPLGHRGDSSKPVSECVNIHFWHHRQYFPMGREKSAQFLSDGVSQFEIDDPDTGSWVISVIYKDGQLIQKRYSASLGLTMYDTRCVLKEKVKLNDDMAIEESDADYIWQLFQWKIIDHKQNDESTVCYYYLKKIDP